MEKILVFFVFSFFLVLSCPAQDRGELDALQSKAREKEEELKKYKEEEQKINKQLSALEQRRTAAQQMINKIEYDISVVEQGRITTANKKEALERSLPVWEESLDKETVVFLANYLARSPYYESGGLTFEVMAGRALGHKSAFAAELKKENNLTADKIEVFEQRSKTLQEQTSKIEEQRTLLTKDFQRIKVDLTAAKKKSETAQKELEEINKSAKELMELLTAVEKKREKEEEKTAKAQGHGAQPAKSVAEVGAALGSLPRPVSGEIISRFGKEYNKDLNVSIFRDGVKISAKKNEVVYSVAEGTVIYSGAFRSYGNVVIIDHGKGFFTVYGYMSKIDVAKGDSVGRRTPIGVVGVDNLQGSMGSGRTALYFEIRRGTAAVDPEPYLQ